MNIAIILAGGTGSRMNLGYNKVFANLNDTPILTHTIRNFEHCPDIDRFVIVAGNQQADSVAHDVQKVHEISEKENFKKLHAIVPGDEARMLSVSCGLEAADLDQNDIVLIQDGGRPFCPSELITSLIKEAETHGASICGATPKDTIQQLNEDGFATHTFDRSKLLAIFTPVAARWKLLKESREKAKREGYLNTPGFEDSALLQRNGIPVKVVYCDYTNIKITTPDDIWLAEKILTKLQ